MAENKTVYIVLTQTGTILSRILKFLYKREYNHVSLSINDSMEPMYSFGRLSAYNPLRAGFVKESVRWGTFKRFYKTTAKILGVEVDEKTYQNIAAMINEIEENTAKYKYNYKSLFYAFFNIHKEYENSFYCSEFIKYILVNNGIDGCDKLPGIIHPTDFTVISDNVIYTGLLKEFKCYKTVKCNVFRQ